MSAEILRLIRLLQPVDVIPSGELYKVVLREDKVREKGERECVSLSCVYSFFSWKGWAANKAD